MRIEEKPTPPDAGPSARRRFELEERGFDEVPKRYRKFYRRLGGAGGLAGPERDPMPRLQGGDPIPA